MDIRDFPRFSAYLAAANVILEYVLASQGAVQGYHQAILSYANEVLLRITGALQLANENGEDIAETDGLTWTIIINHFSNFVNIVTEEPAFPLHELFPQDRIVALERAIIAVQHAASRVGIAIENFIENRAGYRESLEDKLARLRAIRLRSKSLAQEPTPSGTNVSAYVLSCLTCLPQLTESTAAIAGPFRLLPSRPTRSHLPLPFLPSDLLTSRSRQLFPLRSNPRLLEMKDLILFRPWTHRRMLPSQSKDPAFLCRGPHRTTASRMGSCTLRRDLCTAVPCLSPSWTNRPPLLPAPQDLQALHASGSNRPVPLLTRPLNPLLLSR